MPSYKVVSCPSEDLARTNLAYVSPTDPGAGQQLELGGSLVLLAEGHPGVAPGGIGLNALHRKYIRVSVGDDVEASLHSPEAECALVTIDIGPLRKLKGGPETQLDAQQLTAVFLKRFPGQVMCMQQEMSMEFMGSNYLLRIIGVACIGTAGDTVSSGRALLTEKTAFVWDAQSTGGAFKITNQRAQANKQIFKTTEFNFQKLGIGGLDKQFEQIFRRAFASRVFPSDVIEKLGIHHVRGMLLFGPPGTGKTLIARQIGKMLTSREPKVVNGPEVLDKYVGQSEANIRALFADAEADMRAGKDDLHVIIFDELDSVCKQRGSSRDGTGVHDSLVNQLLSKIDGVDSLNNVLLIGMTNRKDMLDEALLRPGRLEVQIEIGLPDEKGRLQILQIHTSSMSTNSFLGRDVDLLRLAAETKNYSGAEIEGLCKSAASFALNRQVDMNDISKPIEEDNIKVGMDDFVRALEEVKPAFGQQTDGLEARRSHGMVDYGHRYEQLLQTLHMLTHQVVNSEKTPLLTVLMEGPPGSGKTALAATAALDSGFPFAKVLSAETMVGFSEMSKVNAIQKVFDDAYKSPMSVIILDDIERLLEFVAIGPRFSNVLLQALLVLCKKQPPPGHRLLVIGTTSMAHVMQEMEVSSVFNVALNVPALNEEEIKIVFNKMGSFAPHEVDMAVASLVDAQVPIKRLLTLVDLAMQSVPKGSKHIPGQVWAQVLQDLRA